MAFTNDTKEAAALAVTARGNWISLHTADPGVTGTSEATGGTPAYARKQTTWAGGAVDGVVSGSSVAVDVPGGNYTHGGIWTAATGGTFVGGFTLSSPTGTLPGQTVVNVVPTVNVNSVG